MLLPTLTALCLTIRLTDAAYCRVEDCSQWFSRTKEYEFLTEGRSERYCQVLHTYLQCLSDTVRFCHGNLQFHSIQYLMKRQYRDYRCEAVEQRKSHENRYFLVQVSSRHNNVSSFTSFVDKVTVIIRKHNCTRQNVYLASSDDLPISFDDGSTHVNANGNRKSIEIIKHEEGYIELNLRYVDSSIHIRRVGKYLSVAVRGPEFVLGAASSLQDQLCWDGCRPKSVVSIEKALTVPKMFSSCYNQKLQYSTKMAEERCRSAGVVDSFFDACVFDLVMTGDDQLLQMSRLAQSDFQRVFPLHYHYIQGRKELVPFQNVTDIVFYDCLPPKAASSLPLYFTLILCLLQFF